MAGKPVHAGSWGDWATIHSQSSDAIQRIKGQSVSPHQTNIQDLKGRQCAHSRNVGNEVIVCQNVHSGSCGRKCPGHCKYFRADWQKVNAIIVGKPNLGCHHCQHKGASYSCMFIHQYTTTCSTCKHVNEKIEENIPRANAPSPKAHDIPAPNAHSPSSTNPLLKKLLINFKNGDLKGKTVYVTQNGQCSITKHKVHKKQTTITPPLSKPHIIVFTYCQQCRRFFISESEYNYIKKRYLIKSLL